MANSSLQKFCHKSCGKIFVREKLSQKVLVMKNEQSIRSLLGMNQNDMALLLGVSRSHYSMFEIGKRSLPIKASDLLAEILAHMKKPATLKGNNESKFQIETDKKLQLQQLLRENEYQQALCIKKMSAIKRKYQKQVNKIKVLEFLNSRQKDEGKSALLFNSLADKTSKNNIDKYVNTLAKMELQQELLILQKSVFETKLKKRKY